MSVLRIVYRTMAKIGVVIPTFTSGAYYPWPSPWYEWYNCYVKQNNTQVTNDLKKLTAKIPSEADWAKADVAKSAISLFDHLKKTRPQDQIATITDDQIHDGVHANFDVLIIFHEEYVTQQMYDNFKSFVENGGVLVAMDGNLFFCEVTYDKAAQTVSLVHGHYWKVELSRDGKPKVALAGLGERWLAETSQWFGSNSDAAPDILHFSYCGTVLGFDPFGYPAAPKNSGAENQYVSNPADMILLEYQPRLISPYNSDPIMNGWPKPIATYLLDYKKGRSLVFGLFTDIVQSHPSFLKFFDKVFEDYAILRSTSQLPKEFMPTHNPRSGPAPMTHVDPNDPKQVLEEKIRAHMAFQNLNG
jgi:hypothetical protein